MDMQTKIHFVLKDVKSPYTNFQTIDINERVYPNGNLGEELIVFTEHKQVTVSFESDDNNAYLELECYNENDMVIVKPGEQIVVSPGNDQDDMMIPGYYSIVVHTSLKLYNGMFKVIPSSLSWQGLENIRKYLEEMYEGLSYNLYIKRLGKQGNNIIHNVFLLEIYSHIHSSQDILANNINLIVNKPFTDIVKEYREQVFSLRPDIKSQRWLSQKGASLNRNLFSPEITYEKHATTNIHTVENKWLRKILHHTIQVLSELDNNFLAIKSNITQRKEIRQVEYMAVIEVYNSIRNDYTISEAFKLDKKRRMEVLFTEMEELDKNSSFIMEVLDNIKKIKSILLHYEYETWINQISRYEMVTKPSLRLLKDHRYGQLYSFYQTLTSMEKDISHSKKFVFPNKKTSKLYEYYNVLLIMKIIEENGFEWYSGWLAEKKEEKSYNGELPSDTIMLFRKDNILCELAYDVEVEKYTGFRTNGYFVRNNARNCRPDIRIALFDTNTGELLSAFIIEVKSRKSKYLYNKQGDTPVMEQINDYYNLAFFDNRIKRTIRGSIQAVIVVYPKQPSPICYVGENNFSFIQIEPSDSRIEPYGYSELRKKVKELINF